MKQEHLTQTELVGLMYEAAPASTHLAQCPQCQDALESLQTVRLAHAEAARQSLDARSLAAQRSHIYARLEEKPGSALSWLWAGAPLAVAALWLFAVNPALFQGTAKPAQEQSVAQVAPAAGTAANDDTLYTDIYQTLSLGAPSSVYTVAGMFDVAEVTTQKSEE